MARIDHEEGVPLPGMAPNLVPEKTGYAWQPAFISYCRGFALEQIAEVYGIPIKTLERRALEEHWAALSSELPLKAAPSTRAADVAVSLEKLEQNRTTNYRMFCKLRDVVVEKLDLLQKGELKIERLFHSSKTGEVTSGYSDPAPADLVSLATAAKIVAEGTYRAIGDTVAAEDKGQKTLAGATSITVLLPGIVAAPKPPAVAGDTAKLARAEVVDLR